MVDTIKPVTRQAHGERSWRRFGDYRFAAASTVVRLAGAEIAHAAQSLPLAFAEGDGKPVLVALLGFVQGQNLFVAPNGRWAGRYVPAALRGWPFVLGRSPSGETTLCFDESSGLLGRPGEGEAFFGADGEASEAVKQVFEFLVRTRRGQEAADAATALLAQHGLLEAWPLKVKDGEHERAVNGLQRVNEAALNALDAKALGAVRDGGALALAYAQLLSMGNISLLGQLATAHAGAASRQVQQSHAHPNGNGNGDLTKMFEPDDGNGMIDWTKLLDD
ncbi:hypothetical protein ATER59S_01005 [Aquamicrobium terrae]